MDCTQDDNINTNKVNDRLKWALNDAQEHRFTLYGRDRERTALSDAYQRVKQTRTSATKGVTATIADAAYTAPLDDERTELVLLHGPVGAGKSGLAHSIRSTVEDDGGYFLSSEFDCIESGEPYQELIHAFTDFSRQIIERSESVHYKEALKQHGISDSKGREWLTKTIPALIPLVRCDPECSEDVPMQDSRHESTRNQSYSVDELEERVYGNSDFHCFKDAFCTLVRAVASHDKPIVFLFENLHWANECSLDVIQALVENKAIEGVLFVGTYTVDTDGSDHLLPRMLEKLSSSTVRYTPLEVLPLNEADISNLLAAVFQCDLQVTALRASTIATQAQGKIQSVWEQLRIRQETDCNEMSLRVWIQSEELSSVDREDIKIVSLLGVRMDSNLISRLISRTEAEFKAFAHNVCTMEMLSYDSNRHCFRFSSRTIKDLVSDCILPHERRSYHYRIGRKLWRMLDSDELNRHIFLVVDQLTFIVDSFDDDKEKTAIANLCLFAGVRAFRLSSFLTSLRYLECGVSLLGTKSWKESYRLCLDLYAATAEVATSLGLFERVYQVVGLVTSNARCFDDTVRLQTTSVHALGIHGRHTDATTLAFELLRRLGEPFPSKPNRLRMLFEFACLRRRLNGRSSESILRLPNMVDTNKLAAMQLLNLVFLSAYIELQSLVPLIGLRLVRMSLDYGLCAVSCVGFAAYAGILCGHSGDVKEGLRMSQLCFSLYERFDSKAWLARLSVLYFDFVHGWIRPLFASRAPLDYACRVGLESGDTEFSLICGIISFYNRFETSRLPNLAVELDAIVERVVRYGNRTSILMTASVRQLIHNYMQINQDNPYVLKGEFFRDETILAVQSCPFLNPWTLIHRSMLNIVFCQYEDAARYADEARVFVSQFFGPRARAFAFYLCGLAQVVYANERRGKRARFAKKCSRLLRSYSNRGEPLNFIDKHYLLEAELASLSNSDEAFTLYTLAIAASEKAKQLFQTALANERTARFLARKGDDARAAQLFRDAIASYTDYGAMAKVQHLQTEVNQSG